MKDRLDQELREIDSSVISANERYYKSAACIHACLLDFRERLLENPFRSVRQEIYFFKRVKPIVLSELMFQAFRNSYRNSLNIEGVRVAYLRNVMKKIGEFYAANRMFSSYIANRRTDMDEYFFVRSGKLRPRIESLFPENGHPVFKYFEPESSTSYDFLLAMLLAAARCEAFARRELADLMPKLLN
ncbi:MAG: RteC domain-containing protein [Bacteroidetes bacterium]|nr:RteC domain-containing protein [Bacteroidota bacterium]